MTVVASSSSHWLARVGSEGSREDEIRVGDHLNARRSPRHGRVRREGIHGLGESGVVSDVCNLCHGVAAGSFLRLPRRRRKQIQAVVFDILVVAIVGGNITNMQ